MAINYGGGQQRMMGNLMQLQAENNKTAHANRMKLIKDAFPDEAKRRETLNLEFGNKLLGAANPGDIFSVGAKNKLSINPEFDIKFPELEEAWGTYNQMAQNKRVPADRAAFEQAYQQASDLYRQRISKTLNSASANFEMDDIKKAISGHQGLLKYTMGEGVTDPSLLPFGVVKTGAMAEIGKNLKNFGGAVAGATGLGALGGYISGGGKGGMLKQAAKTLIPWKPLKDGFDIISGVKRGIFGKFKSGDIAPKDAKFVQEVADKMKLNYMFKNKKIGGKPAPDLDKEGKRALKMLKNVVKKDGIKGLFSALRAKVGGKAAVGMIARLGVGGVGTVVPEGLSTVAGMALWSYTAYQIYDALVDTYNEDGTKKLEAGTTF